MNASLDPDPSGTYLSDIYMSTSHGDGTWNAPTAIEALNTKSQ